MPGLQVPPGYANVKFRFRLEGDAEEMISTLGVDPTGAAPNDVQVLADMASSAFVTSITNGHIPAAYRFVGTTVALGSDAGDGMVAESIVDTPGVMGGSPPPQNVALLVKKQTSFGGRRNRGRFFLPPLIGETGVNERGELASDAHTSVQNALNALYGKLVDPAGDGSIGLQPVLFHGVGRSNDLTPTPITAFVLDRRVATQRRRLRR